MAVAFTGDSAEYRAARDRLPEQGIELRPRHGGGRCCETAAAAWRRGAAGLCRSDLAAAIRPAAR
jgi:hypothetical protein